MQLVDEMGGGEIGSSKVSFLEIFTAPEAVR